MINKKFNTSNLFFVVSLLFIGMAILIMRNPVPIVYAEDGEWLGEALTYGWIYALEHARSDYLVVINLLLLFLASLLSTIISGNEVALLPESIMIVSAFFYSSVATLAFISTKNISSTGFRISLFLLLLLIPLGGSYAEVIGRIVQVGFYMPLISILLLYKRENITAQYSKLLLDILLLLCAATNPVVMAYVFLFVLWKFFKHKKRTIKLFFTAHLTLIIPFFLLALYLIPRMLGVSDTVAILGELIPSALIETAIARAILYPFIFPWYTYFSDTLTVIVFIIWILFIYFAYVTSDNSEAKRFIIYLILGLIVYATLTIIMRPGLTEFLVDYDSTYPDRYFMGINVFSIVLTIISIAQLARSQKNNLKGISYALIIFIFTMYISNLATIFKVINPKHRTTSKVSFIEQLCRSELSISNNLVYSIDIEPKGLKMQVPSNIIDRYQCIK